MLYMTRPVLKEVQDRIQSFVDEEGLVPFADRINVPLGVIRNALKCGNLRTDSIVSITEKIGLEFYIGPPREGVVAPSGPASTGSSDNDLAAPDVDALQNRLADVSDRLAETTAAVEALAVANNDNDEYDEAHPVPVVEVASAAGAGSVIDMEAVTGRVWFRRKWLSDHAIDPKQCAIIGVKGDSMEPTLMDGCSILVDYNRTRRHAGHIYVIRTDDGLVAKRLDHGDTGDWTLCSDNEETPEPFRPWSNDMEIIGEVRWMARTLAGR